MGVDNNRESGESRAGKETRSVQILSVQPFIFANH